MLLSLITAAEESQGAESAISPLAVGATALAVLLVLLVAVLMFGKGREHS